MPPLGAPGLAALAGPLAVIGLFWLAALWVSKRFRGGVSAGADSARARLKIIASKPIGWQSSLIIVEADGRRFLLGAGRQGLTAIGSLDGLPARAPAAIASPEPVP